MTTEQFWLTVVAVVLGNMIYTLVLGLVWGIKDGDDSDDDDSNYAT